MRRIGWWLVIVLVSLASGAVVFVALARDQVGEPRAVGTVCAFEHDPGSGRSADGTIEHRGWLVRREVCVHATDGENEEPVGLAPFLGGIVATTATGAALVALMTWSRTNRRSDTAFSHSWPG